MQLFHIGILKEMYQVDSQAIYVIVLIIRDDERLSHAYPEHPMSLRS